MGYMLYVQWKTVCEKMLLFHEDSWMMKIVVISDMIFLVCYKMVILVVYLSVQSRL